MNTASRVKVMPRASVQRSWPSPAAETTQASLPPSSTVGGSGSMTDEVGASLGTPASAACGVATSPLPTLASTASGVSVTLAVPRCSLVGLSDVSVCVSRALLALSSGSVEDCSVPASPLIVDGVPCCSSVVCPPHPTWHAARPRRFSVLTRSKVYSASMRTGLADPRRDLVAFLETK